MESKVWGATTVGGMEIRFKTPSETQVAVLMRTAQRASRPDVTTKGLLDVFVKVLNCVSALMETDEMREYVDTLMLEDRLEDGDLERLVSAALGSEQGDAGDENPASPKPKPKPKRAATRVDNGR